MPKRYRRDGDDDDDGGRGSGDPRRHLCLVLDDWSKGYGIYEVDVDDIDGDPDDADLDLRADRLPSPPVFRLENPPDERGHHARFAAAGSRVFAIGYMAEDKEAPVLVHDMETGALAVGPVTPSELQHAPRLVAAAAGDLYAFDGWKDNHGQEDRSFKALKRHGRRGWVWRSLQAAPFDVDRIACHATHSDGRTVVFSARGSGTFSFDAEAETWTRLGEWMLPFDGQAYYDEEVEAWVGLHVDEGRRVCACDVVDPGDGGGSPPAWKLVEEEMTHGGERCVAVQLAHLGGDGRFCLVEYLNRRGEPEDVWDDGHGLIYATRFRLRYDWNGALHAARRRARCYAVTKFSTFSFRAFGV